MPPKYPVLKVLIATPQDLSSSRDAMEIAIHRWNSNHSEGLGVFLQPIRWETDTWPTTGRHPQDVINDQLVTKADIIVGAFWTRIGSPTGRSDSGTVEEIQLALSLGKPVMIYFSAEPWPENQIDPEQWQKLKEFKSWCRSNSLYMKYESPEDLGGQLSGHLSKLVYQMKNSPGQAVIPAGSLEPETVGSDAVTLERPNSTTPPLRLLEEAAITELIRQQANDSPVLTGLLRKDIRNKACINLKGIETFRLSDENIIVPFKLMNEGRHPAFEISLSVYHDEEHLLSLHSASPIRRLNPKEESQQFEFALTRAPWIQDYEEWSIDVRVGFNDGIGAQEVHYVIRLEGVDPNFKVWEDTSNAQFHPLCGYTRP